MFRNNIFLKFWFWSIVFGFIYVLFIAEGGYFGDLLIQSIKDYSQFKLSQLMDFFIESGKNIIMWTLNQAKEVLVN